MTINIALATYDGIVLGCDSLSSITDQVIFPFGNNCDYAKDEQGNLLRDASGNLLVSVSTANVRDISTTVFCVVSKIFEIYHDDDTCIAALTAGMATLGGVTIAEQAKRYKRRNQQDERKFVTALDAATDFLAFIRQSWEKQFSEIPEEQRIYLPSIHFIVAGFGANDDYGMIFKLDVSNNTLHEHFPDGDHMGICWSGQANYVERLTKGIDHSLVYMANKEIAEALAAQREATIQDISKALTAAQVQLPEHLELNITEHMAPGIAWESALADIDFGNLSTQYAIDLVELLVNTQSGMQRFARGIPNVGGRTHVGVLKRGEGFMLLNEPKLQHKHTGYADEF